MGDGFRRRLAVLGAVVLGAMVLALFLIPVMAQEAQPATALELYDANDDGEIDREELQQAADDYLAREIDRALFVRVLHAHLPEGWSADSGRRQAVCDEYDFNNDGCVDDDEFDVAVGEWKQGLLSTEDLATVGGCYCAPEPEPEPEPEPSETIAIVSLLDKLQDDGSTVFQVQARNLRTSTSYTIEVRTNNNNATFDQGCTVTALDPPIDVTEGATSHDAFVTLYTCTPGEVVVTATLDGAADTTQDTQQTIVFPRFDAAELSKDSEGITIVAAFTLPQAMGFSYEMALYKNGAISEEEPIDDVHVTGRRADLDTFTPDEPGVYRIGIRPCHTASSLCHDYVEGTDSLTKFNTAPTNLDIIPLPNRRALLAWGANGNPTAHQVEVLVLLQGIGDVWVPISPLAGSATTQELDLDGVIGSQGFHNETKFVLWVRDKRGSQELDSYSEEITIIDTPITRANGNSQGLPHNSGKAELRWKQVPDATKYKIRWRKLPPSPAQGRPPRPHTEAFWYPLPAANAADWSGPKIASGGARTTTIRSLKQEEIFAVQVNFEYQITDSNNRTVTRQGFSVRESYVWPSNRVPGGGERIATFPLKFPVPFRDSAHVPTYAYRICEDTFQSIERWRPFIVNALGEWDIATSNFVRTKYEAEPSSGGPPGRSLPCADYTEALARAHAFVQQNIKEELTEDQNNRLVSLVKSIDNWLDINEEDRNLNEIKMIDDATGVYADLDRVAISPEVAKVLGFSRCALTYNVVACAVTPYIPDAADPLAPRAGTTTDILIRQSHSYISSDPPAVLPPTKFNACSFDSPPKSPRAYGVLVHEAGHAFGIRFGGTGTGQAAHHPTIRNSVMNYIYDEPDCSPHPFDVLAIYALYQIP